MRLICPNCDAQYEVDDAVIPPGGRDVQCSSCGHTWFESRADDTDLEPADAEQLMRDYADVNPIDDDIAPEPQADDTYEPAPQTPPRPKVDDAILGVLREEAEREVQARKSEARQAPLESQPDLGIEPGPRGGLKERVARLRGLPPGDENRKSGNTARRDLLPDIEEINSTLRASSERANGVVADGMVLENTELPRKRSGFGLGFGIVVLITALIVGLYILTPNIIIVFPASEPVMMSFATIIDAIRISVNSWVMNVATQLTDMLNGLTK